MTQHIQDYHAHCQSLVTDLMSKYDPIWKILVPYKDMHGPSGRKLLGMAKKVMDIDDIVSTCYFGACQSAIQFDPAKAKFVTFACRGIYNELRRQLIKYNDFSGNDYESHPKRTDINLEMLLKHRSGYDAELESETIKLCGLAFDKLNKVSSTIIKKYYGIDCPQQSILEIAKELGRTYDSIKNTIDMSIEAVRDEYEGKSLFSPTNRCGPQADRGRSSWAEWLKEESVSTI